MGDAVALKRLAGMEDLVGCHRGAGQHDRELDADGRVEDALGDGWVVDSDARPEPLVGFRGDRHLERAQFPSLDQPAKTARMIMHNVVW